MFDIWDDRLYKLTTTDLEGKTAGELIDGGFSDPLKVIVKNELHSQKKLKEGRVRLIMIESFLDQLIERFLFSDQNRAEILQHESLPSKPGMGLHDLGLASLLSNMKELTNPTASDAKAFDWSVEWWHLKLDAEVRIRCAGLDPDSPLAKGYRNRMWCMAMSRFVFADGQTYDQTEPGVMKSGSFVTAATNSRIRHEISFLVHGAVGGGGRRLSVTMGDDCVESNPKGLSLAEAYRPYGLQIEEAEVLEFCSHDFTEANLFFPQGWAKSVGHYLQTKPRNKDHQREMYAGLVHTCRNHPGWASIDSAIAAVGARPSL